MARGTGGRSVRRAPSLALVILAAMSLEPAWSAELRGIPKVIEGDLIELEGRRLRLDGIDAPESGQRCLFRGKLYDCGAISRAALMDLTAGVEVSCQTLGPETDGVRARCSAGGYDLSEGMVYTGWALPAGEGRERYRRQLEQAKERRHGLWRGGFVAPWDWAAGARLPEEEGG